MEVLNTTSAGWTAPPIAPATTTNDTASDAKRIRLGPWADTPAVYGWATPKRPACPDCGSEKTPTYHGSEDQGDDSRMRKCVCKDCGLSYRMILEPLPLPQFPSPELVGGQLDDRNIASTERRPEAAD